MTYSADILAQGTPYRVSPQSEEKNTPGRVLMGLVGQNH